MTEESIELDGDVETMAVSIPLDEKKKYPHLGRKLRHYFEILFRHLQ